MNKCDIECNKEGKKLEKEKKRQLKLKSMPAKQIYDRRDQ